MANPADVAQIVYLAQTYFHPDYDLDADTPIGVLQNFRGAENASETELLRRQLTSLLKANPNEEELTAMWIDAGEAFYDPRRDGITMREWFGRVLDALS